MIFPSSESSSFWSPAHLSVIKNISLASMSPEVLVSCNNTGSFPCNSFKRFIQGPGVPVTDCKRYHTRSVVFRSECYQIALFVEVFYKLLKCRRIIPSWDKFNVAYTRSEREKWSFSGSFSNSVHFPEGSSRRTG